VALISVNLLPKNLQRVREPGYWRVLAVLVPLVTFAVAFGFQYLAWQTTQNLEREVQAREDQLALLQPFLEEQADLQARQRQLNELIAVADAVQENRIAWTGEITALLETLPARGDGPRPRIDFESLDMRAVVPPQGEEDRYEGAAVVAEMSISGNVVTLDALASFVRALERSRQFGVVFESADRQGDEEATDAPYRYEVTVGALAPDVVDGSTEGRP
jgi:Tfp pilus assembly protein PilN